MSRDRSDTDCVRAALFFAVELLPLALLYVGLIPKKKKVEKWPWYPSFWGAGADMCLPVTWEGKKGVLLCITEKN